MATLKDILIRIVYSRLFALLGWIAAGISTAMAIYFHSQIREMPELTYSIKPVRGVVVRSDITSKIEIYYEKKKIETDITAVQVVLWNAGKRTIRKDDVMNPIIINTENNTPIIEAKIKSVTREVTGLGINTEEIKLGRVSVDWDILEQADGATIQIIYEGKTDLGISVSGIIEGQRQINYLEPPEGTIYKREFPRSLRKYFEIEATFIIAIGGIFLFLLVVPHIYQSSSVLYKIGGVFFVLIMLGLMGVVLKDVLYGYVEPPFGF